MRLLQVHQAAAVTSEITHAGDAVQPFRERRQEEEEQEGEEEEEEEEEAPLLAVQPPSLLLLLKDTLLLFSTVTWRKAVTFCTLATSLSSTLTWTGGMGPTRLAPPSLSPSLSLSLSLFALYSHLTQWILPGRIHATHCRLVRHTHHS